ncbi:hypothetical protein DFH29DRAFT_910696 [Suillus ampliporus]|nr:hypothetical protein DFH29DRAFT_910696 [Suillus ampliporus]
MGQSVRPVASGGQSFNCVSFTLTVTIQTVPDSKHRLQQVPNPWTFPRQYLAFLGYTSLLYILACLPAARYR